MKSACALLVFAGLTLIGVTGAELTMQASPDKVQTCPNNLTISCSLSDIQGIPDVTTLISLVISRRDNLTQSVEDLVSIDAFSGGKVHTHPSLNGSASGKIDQSGESYVHIDYLSPPPEAVGEYLCEAHAMNAFGHPVIFSTLAQVKETKPKVSSTPTGFLEDLLELKAKELSLTDLDRSMFTESTYYGKSKYLASKTASIPIDVAWILCSLYGGYLAEINSYNEYSFIQNFVKMANQNPSVNYYMTGAIYNNTDFEFLRNPNDQMYFDWDDHQPNTGSARYCLSLKESSSWKMTVTSCHGTQFSFLCEIPKSA